MADPSDYQTDPRPAVQTQLSTSLPGVNTHITTHDPETGKSKIHESRQGNWVPFNDKLMAFNTVYTAPDNADMSDEKDLKEADQLMTGAKLGLVREGGHAVRHVDLSPGYETAMHRTVSLDYGIVVEGTVELKLDDGSTTLLRVGDVAVQRGTMHSWRNPSADSWTRLVFVLQSTQPLRMGDKELGEELGGGLSSVADNH